MKDGHSRKLLLALLAALLPATGIQLARGGGLLTPKAVWKDYDPDKGDLREEIVRQETAGGVCCRDSYISAYVLGQEIRVYCLYRVKAGAKAAPGLLDVHGWMGAPSPSKEFMDSGWAVMAFDYCGQTGDRKHYTKYPERIRHGNMDPRFGGPVHATTPDGKSITDPKQSSDYLWYAIQRRVLSYLERQPEVDKTRLGAKGYSYGGTLMWALGTDPRVKAVVAYFGIGWNVYYRDKAVWMYNNPYVEPEKTPGEAIFLASLAPEAYVPYITAATLYLNGSNDHHGGHERGLESFERFQKGVPWSFAVQARGHHNTEKIGQNCKLWLERHVLGKDVFWPAHPQSAIRLDGDGVPELVVTPASPERIAKAEFYYALKSPCSFARSWRDTACVRKGDAWAGKMPVMNVDDYVFGYANITYDNTVVVSTDFNAAIPSRHGPARATDRESATISSGGEGLAAWSNIAEVEGPGGVKGFRPIDNQRGSGTEQLNDPKWRAPAGKQLGIKFHCTQPQTLVLTAGDYNEGEIEIPASDAWQEMAVRADQLINRLSRQPMKDWSQVGKIHLRPKAASDITKVIFAEFRWVGNSK